MTSSRNIKFLLLATFVASNVFGQTIDRIDPPHWWVGFDNPEVELLIHGADLEGAEASISGQGIEVVDTKVAENPNYVFVTLKAEANAPAGKRVIELKTNKGQAKQDFEFKSRAAKPLGLDPSDLIYLVYPDRFSNGNPDNDVIEGMHEAHIARDSIFHRHGGDLQGITNHLDYIQGLGATALWLNPVYENDQPKASYHGYAITDHYRVDRRLGEAKDYKTLSDSIHARGLKLVKDVIFNHIGHKHYFFLDQPMKSWYHQFDEFTNTNYRAPTLLDPYASEYDKMIMSDGWFGRSMPDLNQQNPHVARYLIQQCIWWVENFGIDAFRIDTYAYSDLTFMKDLTVAMYREFPDFFLFGETWVHGTPIQAFFTKDNNLVEDYNSQLEGVTDFQLYYAINNSLTKPFQWEKGASELYYTLAKDILYEDPFRNVTFLDNHDLSRFYSMIGEDFNKFKMGIGLLLTTRGIPMLYYGTEVLMKNMADPDGKVREDFPGGWEGDTVNYFDADQRTGQVKATYDYVSKLANYRKAHAALQTGKLTQWIPDNGVYKFSRYNEEETFIILYNTNDSGYTVDTKFMAERIQSSTSATNIMTGEKVSGLDKIEVPGWSISILLLD